MPTGLGYLNHAYLHHEEQTQRSPILHMHVYACTDVCIVYSIVTKYAFCNCDVAKSCPGTHTALQAPMQELGEVGSSI